MICNPFDTKEKNDKIIDEIFNDFYNEENNFMTRSFLSQKNTLLVTWTLIPKIKCKTTPSIVNNFTSRITINNHKYHIIIMLYIDDNCNYHLIQKKFPINIKIFIDRCFISNKKLSEQLFKKIKLQRKIFSQHNVSLLSCKYDTDPDFKAYYENLYFSKNSLLTKYNDNNILIKCFDYNLNNINNILTTENITKINENCFQDSNINSINLYSIDELESDVFKNCKKLISADISNVKYLNSFCFFGCNNLTYLNNTEKIISLGRRSFHNCNMITNFKCGNNLSSINRMAFFNCYSLSSINLENSKITRLEKYTFANCSSLLSIQLPSALNFIEDNAFYNCSNLSIISFSNFNNIVLLNQQTKLYENCSVIVPNNLYNKWKQLEYSTNNIINEITYNI